MGLCLVIVDKDWIFTAGGHTWHPEGKVLNNAYMLNLKVSNAGWREVPSLSYPRFLHTCSKVGSDLVADKIVVVGGCYDGNCHNRLNSVEIFTVATGSWESGT